MNEAQIEKGILKIIKDNVQKDLKNKVNLDASFEHDLGFNSFAMIKIIVEIENFLDFKLLGNDNDNDINFFDIITIRDAINKIIELKQDLEIVSEK